MKLFEDVGLSEIKISLDGKNISFKIIDLCKGEFLSIIECKNIYWLNYENIFSVNDGLGCYVGEIEYCLASKKEDFFKNIKFSFLDLKIKNSDIDVKNLFFFKIESGDILIYVLCTEIIKDNVCLK